MLPETFNELALCLSNILTVALNDVHLIPLELIRSKRDSVRKAREAHLIIKAKTLHPFGINRRDEARQ